jgi:hypothetical protein
MSRSESSRSAFGARQIGALAAYFFLFVMFWLFASAHHRAEAGWVRDEKPFFQQCGLERLGPADRATKIAGKASKEGRSAASFERWRGDARSIVPGLVAFGPGGSSGAPALFAGEPQARYCPSGARL